MNFGPRGNPDRAECTAIVHRALTAGINLVDTADIYSVGIAEEIVGTALKGCRDDVLIATKVHGRTGAGPNDLGSSRLHILRAVEASLKRLGTDRIDLYQLHLPDADTPIEETLRALDDLVRQGKVLYIGTSNFAGWQLATALWTSERHRLVPIASEQPEYSLLERHIEREILPACKKFGLAVLPWSPLKGGELSGQYRRGEPAPEGSRHARRGTDTSAADWNARMATVEQLRQLAAQAGMSLSQFALLWVMRQEGITSPILGPRTLDQLEDSLQVLGRELPEELAQRAQSLTAQYT